MAAIEVSTVSRYMCTANCMCERVCGYDVRQYASLTLYCVISIAGSSCRRVHDNQESFYVSIFFCYFVSSVITYSIFVSCCCGCPLVAVCYHAIYNFFRIPIDKIESESEKKKRSSVESRIS